MRKFLFLIPKIVSNAYLIYIFSQGAKAIAEGLSVNRSLTWLGLGKNFLGVEGAWALSDGLRANRGLQWLAVGSNSIGDRGATHLATLLSGTNASLS